MTVSDEPSGEDENVAKDCSEEPIAAVIAGAFEKKAKAGAKTKKSKTTAGAKRSR